MKNVYLFYEPDSEKLAEDVHAFLSKIRGRIYEFHKPQLLPDTSLLPNDRKEAVYKNQFIAQMRKLKELLASSIKEEDYIVFINTRRVGNRPFSEIDFENYHIMVDGSRHNYIMPNAPQWLAVSYLIVVSLLLRSFFVDEISVVNAMPATKESQQVVSWISTEIKWKYEPICILGIFAGNVCKP